jgi:tetratricopeptide (TPR) repeat protein
MHASLQQAMALHQRGHLAQAQLLYSQVLREEPRNSDAMHLLGVTHFQLGESQIAVAQIGAAIELDPHNSLAYSNLGNAMQSLGMNEQSIACYDCAVNIDPFMGDAFFNRGVVQQKMARHVDSLGSYAQAIAVQPLHAQAMHRTGMVLHVMDRNAEAVASYDDAIALLPDSPELHNHRGSALHCLGRWSEALTGFERALAIEPAYVDALHNQGDVLHDLKRNVEAVASYDAAIDISADDANLFFNRGVALQSLDHNEQAVRSFERAIALQPDHARAWNNQGNSYQSLDLFQSALASYRQAQSLDSSYGDPHLNEALCLLKTGDFELGWKKYEWRLDRTVSHPVVHANTGALWHGVEDLHGKTILLHAEQGLGDTIQFCRYVTLVAQRGATVTLQVPASLKLLLSDLQGVSKIVSHYSSIRYDFHCPLMSLPLAFGTRLSTIPHAGTYLFGDPHASGFWKAKLGATAAMRIGFVWSGNRMNQGDVRRSMDLLDLSGLWGQGDHWCSLQKEVTVHEAHILDDAGIAHFETDLTTFNHTAALIEQMDLVISVDTAVAHLAAAMGKPTWLMLAHQADFRWLLGRRDSPWYPYMLLLRQPIHGQWPSLVALVAKQLAQVHGDTDPTKRPPLAN